MFGWIMPAPLVMPAMRYLMELPLDGRVNSVESSLGKVSVVMIEQAVLNHALWESLPALKAPGTAWTIRSVGSGCLFTHFVISCSYHKPLLSHEERAAPFWSECFTRENVATHPMTPVDMTKLADPTAPALRASSLTALTMLSAHAIPSLPVTAFALPELIMTFRIEPRVASSKIL